METIGYQHGITAACNRLRDLDPAGTKLKKSGNKWPSIDTLPDDLDSWGAWDKFERALTILVHDHDGASTEPPPVDPPDPPDPPTTYKKVAPRTYNKVMPNGSDARFCTTGLPKNQENGRFYDDVAQYDSNGLCTNGGRSADLQVSGLRLANNMNNLGPCDLYPPLSAWPGDPTKNTGSWAI